jgi:uncharacterized protein YceK
MRFLALVLGIVALGGCGTIARETEQQELQVTLMAYGNALRWGSFDDALKYIDPQTLKDHPVTALDLERYRQVRVTSYNEQAAVPVGPHEVNQTVQISVVNNNTQAERSLVDHQVWRYDETAKHWHNVSGLPDITHH